MIYTIASAIIFIIIIQEYNEEGLRGMKSIVVFFVILAMPLTLYAMTPISDSELSHVVGQSGVTINIDMTMDIQFNTIGWGDQDGAIIPNISTDVKMPGGWVGIDSLQISNLHIWPRTDFAMDNRSGFGINGDEGDWDQLKYLTVDVATVPASILGSVFGTNVPNITAVVINIPTLTMTMDSMMGNVVLGARSSPPTIGSQIKGVYK